MSRFSLCFIAIVGIMTLTRVVHPHPHPRPRPHHQNDPYTPAINFLKQLRKARKHGGGGLLGGNREGEDGTQGTAESSPSFVFTQNQEQRATSTPILFPSSNSQQSSSNGNDKITINLPSNFPEIQRPTTSSPADIRRINGGVSTILQGVRSFDLGQILRGAFIFPRNENVKSVANTVLDSIFGPGGGSSSSNNGAQDAPSFRN